MVGEGHSGQRLVQMNYKSHHVHMYLSWKLKLALALYTPLKNLSGGTPAAPANRSWWWSTQKIKSALYPSMIWVNYANAVLRAMAKKRPFEDQIFYLIYNSCHSNLSVKERRFINQLFNKLGYYFCCHWLKDVKRVRISSYRCTIVRRYNERT